MKDRIPCKNCHDNGFSPGMKEIYWKEVKCPNCKEIMGYRKPTKKEIKLNILHQLGLKSDEELKASHKEK